MNYGKYFRENIKIDTVTEEYCKIVQSLINKNDFEYAKLAFHFIINTETDHKKYLFTVTCVSI